MADDLYETLGVTKSASQDEIKRRYRELAKKYHPDLHPGDSDAEVRFKQISQAYGILGDDEKRGRYDRGEIDAAGQETPERQYYRHYAEADPTGKYYAGSFEDFEDLGGVFEDLFGGRARRAGSDGGAIRMRGPDVRYELSVDFLDAVNGGKKRVTMPDGRTLDIAVPAGVRDGQQLRLRGEGHPGIGGGEPGDAYVTITVQTHPRFRRRGDDILLTLPVTLKEAVLGAKVKVPTISGGVSLTIPEGSNAGDQLRLRGKGVAAKGRKPGDQLVTLKVVLPGEPDEELKAFLRDWDGGEADPRRAMGV